MSLATRCASCGTIFKVVQDQLKVAEGWVRCGRCNEVFNALDNLFDLEREAPPKRPAHLSKTPAAPRYSSANTAATPTAVTTSIPSSTGAVPQANAFNMLRSTPAATAAAVAPQHTEEPTTTTSGVFDHVPSTYEDDALDSRWLIRPGKEKRTTRARRLRHDQDSDFVDARFPTDVELDLEEIQQAASTATPAVTAPLGLSPATAAAPAEGPSARSGRDMPAIAKVRKKTSAQKKSRSTTATHQDTPPEFIKRAERIAQWRHPLVRLTLSGVALTLVLLMILQISVVYRDELGARYPQLRATWLEPICKLAGCKVQAWQHIDSLAVDSHTLTRSETTSDDNQNTIYKLTVEVKNQALVPIAVPHVELTLTGENGVLLSRRVLSPTEFGYHAAQLAAHTTTNLQLQLASSGTPFQGYTVELFYP